MRCKMVGKYCLDVFGEVGGYVDMIPTIMYYYYYYYSCCLVPHSEQVAEGDLRLAHLRST